MSTQLRNQIPSADLEKAYETLFAVEPLAASTAMKRKLKEVRGFLLGPIFAAKKTEEAANDK